MNKLFGEIRRSSLFGYILSFSAIMVSIILVMGAYLYQFYYQTIYNDFKNVNETHLSVVRIRHENDLAIVNDIMVQMSLSSSNTEFKLEEVPIKSIALEEQLYRYLSVSQFFSHVFFFYHDDSYLYNHSTSIDISRFLSKGIILENVTEEEFLSMLYNKERGMKVLEEQKVDGYLSRKFNDLVTQVVVYIFLLEPKKTSTMIFIVGDFYYDELLGSEAKDQRQDFILYHDKVIVSRGELGLSDEGFLQRIEGVEETQFQTEFDGKKYLVTLQQGDSGIRYCTVQSMNVFQKKIVTEQWGILFILLLCSIPTSLLIVALSRRLSRRVRAINVLLSKDEEHYYDLENIENGIRTLMEHNKEVSEESLLSRRIRFIHNFVRNDYSKRETVIAYGEKVKIKVDKNYYAITLMGTRGNSNESKAHEMMLSEIDKQADLDGFVIHLINKNQSLFVVFGNSIDMLEDIFERFFTIGMAYSEDFIMSASGFHQDFKEASEAYLEADTAYDNRLLVDNSRIIRFSDIADREQVNLLPNAYLQRLKNAIRYSDEAEVKKIIREICNHLRTSRQSLLAFRILCNDIIHLMITEWNANQISYENIYSVFSLSECLTIKDFNDILWEVCSKLINSRAVSGTESSDMVVNAINYMKKEYQNPDFNMSALAENLKVSDVTLAVKFKNEMGMSPSDYLAIIRVENAKVLLKETQLLVKEISLAVGYEDDHVFTRRFKKYVGKTPGQYRIDH